MCFRAEDGIRDIGVTGVRTCALPIYHSAEPYKKAIRKRQVWVEPLFAEAKEWHGLRRLRLRGLLNANIQGLLIAAGQNLKRLLSRWGWGRRPWPSGAAGVVLPVSAAAPTPLG